METTTQKVHTPLKLTKYSVINSQRETNIDKVDNDIRNMMSYVYEQEETLFHSKEYSQLVSDMVNGEVIFKGSMNSFSRKLFHPTEKYEYQSHNMSEMFRQSVMEKTQGYVQRKAVNIVLSDFDEAPKDMKIIRDRFREYFPHLKAPTYSMLSGMCHKYFSKNMKNENIPGVSDVLKLYSCDMHFSTALLDGEHIVLSLKTKSGGLTELLFDIPQKDRFRGDKVSRPTIRINDKSEVEFCFSITSEVEKVDTTTYLGIDLGKVELYVGTVIDPKNKTFSPPYHTSKKINKMSDKLKTKYGLAEKLKAKRERNLQSKHYEKAEVLKTERERVLNDASRLKREISREAAREIVNVALKNNSTIVVEDLRWLKEKGGKWNHSMIQEDIQSSANRKGIPTKKVNAKDTSQKCPKCRGKVTHYKRHSKCVTCSKKLNRDNLGSRNVSLKGSGVKTLQSFKQSNSAQTRASYTVPAVHGSAVPEKVTLLLGEMNYDDSVSYDTRNGRNHRESKPQ